MEKYQNSASAWRPSARPPIDTSGDVCAWEYFAVGNPGGDLLGDWRLEDPSVAKVGGDMG